MATDIETTIPVAIERLEEILEALRGMSPARLIIRSDAAVAELTCSLGDFRRKDPWLNYECDQFHAHINLGKVRSIALVEKGVQRSAQFLDEGGAVVFRYYLKDDVGHFGRLKEQFA